MVVWGELKYQDIIRSYPNFNILLPNVVAIVWQDLDANGCCLLN